MAVTRADSSDFDAKMAGADLRPSLMYAAKIDTDGRLVLAASGDLVHGIITETGNTNEPVTVQTQGLTKAVAQAGITAGARVMAHSNGKIITATGAGKNVLGVARNTVANADEIVEIQIARGQVPA